MKALTTLDDYEYSPKTVSKYPLLILTDTGQRFINLKLIINRWNKFNVGCYLQ